MSPEEQKLTEKLEEAAVFLRPLNYFWHKALKTLLNEARGEGWVEKAAAILHGRNQLGDLFISPPKEREQFRVLLGQLKEALEPLIRKEV